MSDKLGMVLSKVLFEREPKLLVADMDATARAAAEVSNLLGCIMANVMVKQPSNYEAAFKAIMSRVHEAALSTAGHAFTATTNNTPH